MPAAFNLGLIYGLMTLGVYLAFRVLDIVDLIVDSSFMTGVTVATVMIIIRQNPWPATLGGFLTGCVAGTVTGLPHVNAGIRPLLVGALTQIGLYPTNLHTLGKASVPLLRGVETLLTPLRSKGLLGPWISVLILAALIVVIITLSSWFLSTQIGLGMHSAGDNEGMARAQRVSAGTMKIIGLALSNGLVVNSRAIIVQYQGYADVSMGVNLIVANLASIIIDTVLIGSQGVWITSLFVVIGPIVYRVIIQFALGVEFLEANDTKLIPAIIVSAALVIPRTDIFSKIHERYRNHSLVPEPGITHTPERRDNEKVVL